MKDIVKISDANENYSFRETVWAIFIHILISACGIITSRAVVFSSLLPFGLAFLAGCPASYTPAAAIGVFIGYFLPAVGGGGFRYLAALFAILAIKLLLNNYKKIVNNPTFLGFIAFLANILTSAVMLGEGDITIGQTGAESLLCFAATFFIVKTFYILNKFSAGHTADELSSLLIVSGIVLLGLNEITVAEISLGRILGVFMILSAAKYGGIVSGAISGISIAFAFSLGGMVGSIGIAFATAGLVTGVFAALGKYAQIGAFLIFAFIGSMVSGDTELISRTVIESAVGSLLFLTLPSGVSIFLGKIFSARPNLSIPDGIKKSVTMRLDMASNALRDVSETVEQVSHELAKINAPDFGKVISLVEQDACSGCKLRIHCWEKKREDTVNAVLEMTKAVKKGDCSPENSAPEEFRGRCVRASKVGNSAYKRYSDYASRIAAENRIDEVRSVVSDQFDGISEMLSDLAEDFKNDERFDSAAAENSAAALKNLNIRAIEAGSRIDKFGRMTLEFKVKKTPDLVINKMQVMKLLSVVCEREFDIPNISESGGDIFITLNEYASMKIDIGAEQMSAGGSSMCGDSYKYFNDGKGHFIMILSDGMGTGGRAAVDGAMASGLMSRLVKAGFGYNCSLRILNSSMLFKSTDESLATVDIASIDLFTGQVKLYKAGAAPTIVRRSGKTGKAESTSLPAGILRDIGFDSAVVKCKVGDIVVMLSDGASVTGTDWIRAEIESWKDGSAQHLATHLCECAKRRRNGDREDDITILAAIINKA